MTIRRLLTIFAVALLFEGVTFAWSFDDLLYLRRPLPAILSDGPDTFARHATGALRHSKLTARHLETIVAAADSFHLLPIERQALERRALQAPDDRSVLLRLADVLRRSGDYDGAEAVYRRLLAPDGHGPGEAR